MGNVSNKSYLRKNKIAGQFSARTIEMMESSAFRVLSLSAHRVLARIEIEHAHHGGNDNGKLPVTHLQFVEYGIHGDAVCPAIREVCALGFAEITEPGRAGNGEWRRPNLFRLTYRQVDRADPTDEWRRIKTIEEAEMIAQTARGSRRKIISHSRKTAGFAPENHERKPDFHTPETMSTGHTPEIVSTSISWTQKAKPRLVTLSLPATDEQRLLEAMIQFGRPRLAALSARLENVRPLAAA
jgi:hypothetical protein